LRLKILSNNPYVMGRSAGVCNSKPEAMYVEVSEYRMGKPFTRLGRQRITRLKIQRTHVPALFFI
jgi:hypothetical protein